MIKRLVRIATLTISDSRTKDDDQSGDLLGTLLRQCGYDVISHDIIKDEVRSISDRVRLLCDQGDADAVVTNGGTGVAPRDCTIEALEPLLDKHLPGFGEAFRRLSFDEIGPRAVLSRSLAGTRGHTLLIALPGSPRAVRLAVELLLGPLLSHAVDLLRGHTQH
jgi:molybdopterin adenylyltransferase